MNDDVPDLSAWMGETLGMYGAITGTMKRLLDERKPIAVLKRMGARTKLQFNKVPMPRQTPSRSFGVVKRPHQFPVKLARSAWGKPR